MIRWLSLYELSKFEVSKYSCLELPSPRIAELNKLSSTGAERNVSGRPGAGQPGARQGPLAAQHLHLQSQDVQGGRGAVEARGAVGVARKRHLVLAGHAHHVHLPDALRFLPVGHAG